MIITPLLFQGQKGLGAGPGGSCLNVLLPALRRLRWEDLWFEASLGCQMYPGTAWVLDRMKPCFKNSPPKKN